jgi:hypothetical protein
MNCSTRDSRSNRATVYPEDSFKRMWRSRPGAVAFPVSRFPVRRAARTLPVKRLMTCAGRKDSSRSLRTTIPSQAVKRSTRLEADVQNQSKPAMSSTHMSHRCTQCYLSLCCRYLWTNAIAMLPSPTAEATRLTGLNLTSPQANKPGTLDSRR